MGIITKEVEVKPTGKMIQYYKDKGYDAKHRVSLIIKVEDLPRKSFINVEVLCDYCNETVCTPTYMDYQNSIEKFGKYACKKCGSIHMEKVFMDKYGVDNPAKLESTLRKMAETMTARYGVPYSAQSPELWEKMVRSWEQNYGVNNPSKNDNIRKKIVQTCQIKFGADAPAQSLEVKKKISRTLYENSSQRCSKQQLYLYNLLNINGKVKLNFSISCCSVDICFPKEKLIIEYDGGGHNLRVKTGKITQEEFDQKEIVRNNIIKREGYKQMRIISSKDLLPQDSILLQMLQDTRNYFSDYPNHSWIEFNIDTSSIRNAENKNGTPYDFGSLRRIKDEDLTNQNQNQTKQNKI